MKIVSIINLALIVALVLLLRKLVWCLRWLWCYYHGREVPEPIGFLPRQSGRIFDRHVQHAREDEEV